MDMAAICLTQMEMVVTEAVEEALEAESLREAMLEGRGDREDVGTREEWAGHVGVGRKEDIRRRGGGGRNGL